MTDPRLAELVERAFDYRGYVTLRRSDGSSLVGFVYDRDAGHLELFDESATRRVRVALSEIAGIDFTGEDSALRSQQMWERRKGRLEPRDTPTGWEEQRPILLLVAIDRELRSAAQALGLTRRGNRATGRRSGSDFVALSVGIGGGARAAIAAEQPRAVVSCGFCGGIDQVLSPGDLILATAVRDESGQVVETPESLRTAAARGLQGMRFFEGDLACTSSVAATPAEKRALARPGTLAVDMESFTVARAAADVGIPWLALRAVIDPLESSLPAFTRETHGSHLGPALRYAASGPRAIIDLIRLSRDARRAASSLEAGLQRLGAAIASEETRP
ncbi:MAG TPA: hypothetical protein VEP66_17705 [Myxococcales bacterium]|nr:hypothetical protein [Myxococcales bacterium]